MICQNAPVQEPLEPNWERIANHLARKARVRHIPLPWDEIHSLAGLAVAMVRVSFDPAKAKLPIGVWTCFCGWLQLLTLIRNELSRRRREPQAVCFTDLEPRQDDQERGSLLDWLSQFISWPKAQRDVEIDPDWLEWLLPVDRKIVGMRRDGWTPAEVAQALGQSQSWVRSRVKGIQARLVRIVETHG